MLIAGFPAGPWGTNCYVAATGPGTECVVIDPGKDAAEGVAEVVREHRLKPVAVLVTHGHVDHMWCVAPVAGTYDATAWIHPADRHLLSQPDGRDERRDHRDAARREVQFAEPDRVEELSDAQTLELAGLRFVVDHTPGHTEGSVTFRTPYDDGSRGQRGDVHRRPALRRLDRPHRPARRRPPDDAAQPAREGADPARRHRRAARPRRADQHRPRARHQPVPARPDGRRPGRRPRSPGVSDDGRPHPAQRVPRVPARPPPGRAAGRRAARAHLRAARLRQRRDPRGRAARPAAARGGDLQGGLRRASGIHDEAGRRRARPALRPDRAVRALRARERRQAGVPVPPLPDPEGVARRAAAGGPLPRVHPGRHRRDRPRRARRSTTTSRSPG